MSTTADELSIAIQHHLAGRLQAAEQGYLQVLRSNPAHPDALHLLGVVAHQVGNHEQAIEYIRRSIQLNPNQPHVHNNLGGVFRALRSFPEAAACYQRALELKPDYVEAHINLGNALTDLGQIHEAVSSLRRAAELSPSLAAAQLNLGTLLARVGQRDEAVACYTRTLELHPDDIETRINLGNLFKELGKLNDAAACYRQAIVQKPDLAIARINLGVALKELGNVDEAIACYRRGLELNPESAEAFNNLGIALFDLEKFDEAIGCFERALELKPHYPDAFNNLGNALNSQGKPDQAIVCYRKALALQPDFAAAHNNLGVVWKGQGKLDEAVACYQRALQSMPDDTEALANLGDALKSQGKLDEAAACCRRALDLKPDCADGYNHLGNVLKDQGKLAEAIACYRRTVALNPADVAAHSNLIYTQLFCPGYDRAAILEEHRRWNECHAAPLAKFIQPHRNDRSPDRRLRVGYVSPDFRNHVVGRNVLPLFREHDYQQFEIVCYADVRFPDEMTQRFRDHADLFRNTAGLTDVQLTDCVREDRIDILVDLTLHMASNRLLVFARKPAPIQVTFAGYPGTTGLTTIDFRLTDPYLDPVDQGDDCYSEESMRLPDSFWCYDPMTDKLPVSPLPAIENGYLTFGCLNNFCKVNAPVLQMWARALNVVDRARLIMLTGEGTHRQRTLQVLADEGIPANRVTFVCNQPRYQYLRNYHDIDIALDSVPYNGHSTSLDALWMGVPVVTLAGSTVAGRAGLSQLMNVGLPELIAESPEQFVQIATELARNLPRLSGIRSTLRQRMETSALMDAPRFAQNIQAAFRQMWTRWCRG